MEPIEAVDYNHIRTRSGKYVNVFDPVPEMFEIEDIAHALSNIPRWAGHCKSFYSVAEHSVLCARNPSIKDDPKLKYQALMHDASEAFLLDMPSPIKKQLGRYKTIEFQLMHVLAKRFDFQFPLSEEVKAIDQMILIDEWDQLMTDNTKDTLLFNCYPPDMAKQIFLNEYTRLRKELDEVSDN